MEGHQHRGARAPQQELPLASEKVEARVQALGISRGGTSSSEEGGQAGVGAGMAAGMVAAVGGAAAGTEVVAVAVAALRAVLRRACCHRRSPWMRSS